VYEIYFDFLGQTIILPTEYHPSEFVDGFWIYVDDEDEVHISETSEDSEYLIPPHRIITFRKIKEEGD
jgi:hypothetical protein